MTKEMSAAIRREFSKLNWISAIVFTLIFIGQAVAFYYIADLLVGNPADAWFMALAVASVALLVAIFLTYAILGSFSNRIRKTALRFFQGELKQLRAAG